MNDFCVGRYVGISIPTSFLCGNIVVLANTCLQSDETIDSSGGDRTALPYICFSSYHHSLSAQNETPALHSCVSDMMCV